MKSKHRAWVLWVMFAEGLILAFAAAGPGYRRAIVQDGDPGLIAHLFFEDPTFWETVGVNFAVLHIAIVGAWTAAWVVGRKRKGPDEVPPG